MVQDLNFDKKSKTNLSEEVAWYSLVLKKQKLHYDEHGWCILPTVIPSPLLDLAREKGQKLRKWIQENKLQGTPAPFGASEHWNGLGCAMMYEEELEHCYLAPFMHDIVCTLLDTQTPYLFNDQMVYKMGDDPDFFFEPHYDNQYGPNVNNEIHTVNCSWILDDHTMENGCMWIDNKPILAQAGDIVCIRGDTIHGSGANRTDAPRGLYACVYTESPIELDNFYNIQWTIQK